MAKPKSSLFYVAVTRARDQLYLCAPEVRSRRDGGLIPYMPSLPA